MSKSASKKNDEINPIVLAVIGIVVAGSSLAINLTQESNFIVFIIIGLIMFSYGTVKYIIVGRTSGLTSVKKGKGNVQSSSPMGKAPNTVHRHQSHNTNASHPHQNNMNFCPRCGLKMTVKPNFCPNCGLRLR
ncbi:MAG: hypothetical protein ACLFSL_00100 [Candidatus Woesearchaeota archaeon]